MKPRKGNDSPSGRRPDPPRPAAMVGRSGRNFLLKQFRSTGVWVGEGQELEPRPRLNPPKFFFIKTKVVPHFMQQGVADLAADFRFGSRYGFDVFLIEENMVRWGGVENTLFRARDAVKKSEQ